MLLPNPKDAVHRAWLYRTLIAIVDDSELSHYFCFKGGTCAAMRGYLNRFSVDLDFDFVGETKEIQAMRKKLEKIFSSLGLEIKDKSQKVPQYFLKYPATGRERNTLKIDVNFPVQKNNQYEFASLIEIDRVVRCQTIETMFASKLVALIERHERKTAIAGRDLYDIHHFFFSGYKYNKELIEERRGVELKTFFNQLIEFIDKKINNTVIDQDLNTLLVLAEFKHVRRILKSEVLQFLRNEIETLV